MKFLTTILFIAISYIGFSQLNQVDSQGRKQGAWAKKYEGSSVYQYKGQFENDKPVGKFTYYYKANKVKAIIKHEKNSSRSEAYFYHENGNLMSYGIYRNMLKDSIWLNFGPTKRLSNAETFKNGELNGKRVIYYVPADINDRSRRLASVANYSDDKLEGEYTEYFENQVIKTKGQYSSNKKVGIWYMYHANGKKMNLIRYKNGQRHGWSFAYDETGKQTAKKYFYYGRLLEGEKLADKMRQLKDLGVNPNN